jgi:hypothetical protein
MTNILPTTLEQSPVTMTYACISWLTDLAAAHTPFDHTYRHPDESPRLQEQLYWILDKTKGRTRPLPTHSRGPEKGRQLRVSLCPVIYRKNWKVGRAQF